MDRYLLSKKLKEEGFGFEAEQVEEFPQQEETQNILESIKKYVSYDLYLDINMSKRQGIW